MYETDGHCLVISIARKYKNAVRGTISSTEEFAKLSAKCSPDDKLAWNELERNALIARKKINLASAPEKRELLKELEIYHVAPNDGMSRPTS